MAQTINNLNLLDLGNLTAYLSKQKDPNNQPINVVDDTNESSKIKYEDLKF